MQGQLGVDSEIRNYTLKKLLGKGAYGAVWKAEFRNQDGVMVRALKISVSNEANDVYYNQEWNIMEKLRGEPNILQIYQHFNEKGLSVIAMEFCNQGDLRRYHQITRKNKMQVTQVYKALRQIMQGVSAMHAKNIIHRDLKKQNILVHKEGDDIVYKIADFGVSKVSDHNSMAYSFVGTYNYMAEQILNNDSYDFRVDVWSLGVIFYSLRFGEMPFEDGINVFTDVNKKIKKGFRIPEHLKATPQEFKLFANIFIEKNKRGDFMTLILDPEIRKLIVKPNSLEETQLMKTLNQALEVNIVSTKTFTFSKLDHIKNNVDMGVRFELSKFNLINNVKVYIQRQYKSEFMRTQYLKLADLVYQNLMELFNRNLAKINGSRIEELLGFSFKMKGKQELKKDQEQEIREHYKWNVKDKLRKYNTRKKVEGNVKDLCEQIQKKLNPIKLNDRVVINLLTLTYVLRALPNPLLLNFEDYFGYYLQWHHTKTNEHKSENYRQKEDLTHLVDWIIEQSPQILSSFIKIIRVVKSEPSTTADS